MEKLRIGDYDAFIELMMQKFHVPGLSIAIFNHKDVVAKGFGHARLSDKSLTTPNSLYDMASTSKSFTAASIGKLIANKHPVPGTGEPMTWTTPVSKLLAEDFVLADDRATADTTIEDILCHRSGVPRHDDSYLGIHHDTPDTPQSVTRNLRNLSMFARRLEKYSYCNMMYTVATHIVETLTGTPFSVFLQTNIFDPLGMKSTYLQPSAVEKANQSHRFAYPYVWREETNSYDELRLVESPEAQGAGSLQSTVLDYAKWVQAMMTKNEALFPAEIYNELVKPRIICEPDGDEEDMVPFQSGTLYALAWEQYWYRGYKVITHDGGISGYSSTMLYVPNLDFGLVMCGTADGQYRVNQIMTFMLLDEVIGISPADRADIVERSEHRLRENKKSFVKSRDELIEKIGEGRKEQEVSLEAYTGRYYNAGYHDATVEVKDGHLHIDGSKRSNPITIDLEHIRDDRFFVATLIDDQREPIAFLKTEFTIDEKGKVTSIGIDLCDELGGELIWFQRT